MRRCKFSPPTHVKIFTAFECAYSSPLSLSLSLSVHAFLRVCQWGSASVRGCCFTVGLYGMSSPVCCRFAVGAKWSVKWSSPPTTALMGDYHNCVFFALSELFVPVKGTNHGGPTPFSLTGASSHLLGENRAQRPHDEILRCTRVYMYGYHPYLGRQGVRLSRYSSSQWANDSHGASVTVWLLILF